MGYNGGMDKHPLRVWRHEQTPRKTLVDLAASVGITPSHLSQIEMGERRPSLDVASRISKQTGIPLEQFVRETAQ